MRVGGSRTDARRDAWSHGEQWQSVVATELARLGQRVQHMPDDVDEATMLLATARAAVLQTHDEVAALAASIVRTTTWPGDTKALRALFLQRRDQQKPPEWSASVPAGRGILSPAGKAMSWRGPGKQSEATVDARANRARIEADGTDAGRSRAVDSDKLAQRDSQLHLAFPHAADLLREAATSASAAS